MGSDAFWDNCSNHMRFFFVHTLVGNFIRFKFANRHPGGAALPKRHPVKTSCILYCIFVLYIVQTKG